MEKIRSAEQRQRQDPDNHKNHNISDEAGDMYFHESVCMIISDRCRHSICNSCLSKKNKYGRCFVCEQKGISEEIYIPFCNDCREVLLDPKIC